MLDWTQAKAPRATSISMRQFTPWAQALGGFLAHHGIDGFLTNIADVRKVDEDATRWGAFLECWHSRHGSTPMTASALRADAEPDLINGMPVDRWDGTFITTKTGRLPNAMQLGRLLGGQGGRWRDEYVIRVGRHERGNRDVYHVERHTG